MDKFFEFIRNNMPSIIPMLFALYLFKLNTDITRYMVYGIKINFFVEMLYVSLTISMITIPYFMRKKEQQRLDALKHDEEKL